MSSLCQEAVLPGDGWRVTRSEDDQTGDMFIQNTTSTSQSPDELHTCRRCSTMFVIIGCFNKLSPPFKIGTFVCKDLHNRQFSYGWSVKVHRSAMSNIACMSAEVATLTAHNKNTFPRDRAERQGHGPVLECVKWVSATQGFGHHCRGEIAPCVSRDCGEYSLKRRLSECSRRFHNHGEGPY